MGKENWYRLSLLDRWKTKGFNKDKNTIVHINERESLPRRCIIINLYATWNIQSENGMNDKELQVYNHSERF